MSTRDEPWPDGTPCWADLGTTDLDASGQFYRAVMGWDLVDMGEQFGHYTIAQKAGSATAAIGPAMEGAPAAWTTYLATSDLDKSVEAVTSNGGRLVAPAMDIPGNGRMAIATDPNGAVFGLWQADGMIGAGVVNEPSAMVWNENTSRDTARAREFYAAVLGYSYTAMEGEMDYSTIDGAGPGNTVGGIGAVMPGTPEDVPAHWMTYFAVDDADAFAASVTEHGGAVVSGPFDTPFGRIGVVRDPQGALFSIMQDTSGSSGTS